MDINEATFWLLEDKLTALLPAFKKLEAGDLHGRKEVTSLLRRLQWVAKAFPAISSDLQPLHAWEQKLQRRCKPSQLVRCLAALMLRVLDRGPCAPFVNFEQDPVMGAVTLENLMPEPPLEAGSVLPPILTSSPSTGLRWMSLKPRGWNRSCGTPHRRGALVLWR